MNCRVTILTIFWRSMGKTTSEDYMYIAELPGGLWANYTLNLIHLIGLL